jgi:hypothetical protein
LLERLAPDLVVLHEDYKPVRGHLADPRLIRDELLGLRVTLAMVWTERPTALNASATTCLPRLRSRKNSG